MKYNLDNITESIGYLTGKANRLFREVISRELQKNGVEIPPSHMPIMGYMGLHSKQQVSQRTLGVVMELDRHRISRAVNELQNMGWLSIVSNPENKRENLVEITPQGRDVLKTIADCASVVIEEAYEGVPAEHRQITENTLHQILINLTKNELQEG